MKLKVCGLTTVAQIEAVAAAGADYAGLIFYEKSKRYAHDLLQDQLEALQKIDIKKTGVFVNADMGFLKSMVALYQLAAVQLHGDETPDLCKRVKEETETEVIKAFRVGVANKNIDELIAPFFTSCDYFLFDTETTGYGGSGKQFDWAILQQASIGKPFYLSGGIGPDSIEAVQKLAHPQLYAVDINSRFELSPGIKDLHKIRQFASELKQKIWAL